MNDDNRLQQDEATEVSVEITPKREAVVRDLRSFATGSGEPVDLSNVEDTIITQDVVITGSITAKSNLKIAGTVQGDVSSDYGVWVTGSVEGNVRARAVEALGATIKGDVHSYTSVNLNSQSTIVGNVTTMSANIDGKLEGDVTAGETVILLGNARVTGDIAAASLSVSDGAAINGTMKINSK